MSKPGGVMRADIQALRALAVLYVVINHLWPEWLPGGYVGVDIFFVISGFLITGHLLREFESSGRVALGRFWARRARRLLPAALLVLAVSAVLATLFVPPVARQNEFVQVGWAALYVLNWALAGQSLDYFAQDDGQTMVVHYWSLSVEEQFYLVWPLILLLVFALAKATRTSNGRRLLFPALSVLAVLSLAWAQIATNESPEAAYFQTTSRVWEFAAGGILAVAPALSAKRTASLQPLLWIGWGGLVASAFILDGNSGVPGLPALLPVASAVLVIGIGEASGSPLKRLTGARAAQSVGGLSYSAYLWHFPLIVVTPYLVGANLLAWHKLVILLLTFVLALGTKRLVEDPIRFGRVSRVRPGLVLVGTVTAMALVAGTTFGATAALRAHANQIRSDLVEDAQDGGECFGAQAVFSGADCPSSHLLADPAYLEEAPVDTFGEGGDGTRPFSCESEGIAGIEAEICFGGVKEGQQDLNVALVGDSHVSMWRSALANVADDYRLRIQSRTLGGCPPSLDPDLIAIGGVDQDGCLEWRRSVIEDVASDPDIDVVVTSSRANMYRYADGSPDHGTGYTEAWKSWLQSGKDVIVINDVPILSEAIVPCVTAEGVRVKDPCTRPRDEARGDTTLSKAAESMTHPRFHFTDYVNVFCDDELCHSIIGSIPAYRDSSHLSEAFVLSFGDEFLRKELRAISKER
ncbi:acyltransferase family protein [Microbacterium oryzae]|uniref:acyltransferase family protein n=1 Tax=Microbacterium oryzae TaxID=743009 RepID=UPI0025AFC908|nr:acyltransferase family protein [Microbacterium oryzae]MDN3310447.1 acyltransferase family protein [Microbacterium oryzae]